MTQKAIFLTRIRSTKFHKINSPKNISGDCTFRTAFLFHCALVFWSVLHGVPISQQKNISVPPKSYLS